MGKNYDLFEASKKVIPGGVNSPVRAFKSVGGVPCFFKEGKGALLVDEESNTYIDYVGAWGPAILGHAHTLVIEKVKAQLDKGFGFGAPHQLELELCKLIVKMLPSAQKVRLLNSGTEAAMTAVRLARGITGRNLILKFSGCYHGHADTLLCEAGSGVATLGIPGTPGIPSAIAAQTIVAPFADFSALKKVFDQHGERLAAVIVEPIAGNMNFIRPDPEFLKQLRHHCSSAGALLIFDEVMTGFRVGKEGAQGLFNATPDLTVLGKVVGGGMPLAALAGASKYMDYLAPFGKVYQAGTLSGNPVAVSAGLATLSLIESCGPEFYGHLNGLYHLFAEGVRDISKQLDFPIVCDGEGGMFGVLFGSTKMPSNFNDFGDVDVAFFAKLFHHMLDLGVYLPPSVYECCFISYAHTSQDITRTLECLSVAIKRTLK